MTFIFFRWIIITATSAITARKLPAFIIVDTLTPRNFITIGTPISVWRRSCTTILIHTPIHSYTHTQTYTHTLHIPRPCINSDLSLETHSSDTELLLLTRIIEDFINLRHFHRDHEFPLSMRYKTNNRLRLIITITITVIIIITITTIVQFYSCKRTRSMNNSMIISQNGFH